MFIIERVKRVKRKRGQQQRKQRRQRGASSVAALTDLLELTEADTRPVPTVPLPVIVPMPDGAPLGGIVTLIAPKQERPTIREVVSGLGGMRPDPDDLPDDLPDLPDFPDIADEVHEDEPTAEDAPTQRTQRLPVVQRVIASNLGPLIVARVADPSMLPREIWN